MQNRICAKRTNSIDIFRLLCSVMVVVIHSSFWEPWGKIGFFIGNIFPRIAVPFFFAISGYFYIKKLQEGKKVFLQQIKRLLATYAVWSFVYYLIAFIEQILIGNGNIIVFCKDAIFSFLIIGSTGHFWFFPAIIIATCMVTLFYKVKLSKILLPLSLVLYVIVCLGCSYYGLGVKVLGPLFHNAHFQTIRRIFLMGFPFFCAGEAVLKLEKKFKKSRFLGLISFASAVIFVVECIFVSSFEIAASLVLTFGLYGFLLLTILFLLQHPLDHCTVAAQLSRTLANFTYYSHPLFQKLFALLRLPQLAVFALTLLTAFTVGALLHQLIRRYRLKVISLFVG